MKIYKYDGSYTGYDGSYHPFAGYTLADNKDDAEYNIRCGECIDNNVDIYIEETKVIKTK